MWLLYLIMVHSFFMAATPSVLPYTPGIPARHRIVRKTVGEEAQCSSAAGSQRQMAPPHQADLSPPAPSWPPWQVGVCIAGRGSRGGSALQSSSRWQVFVPSLPVSGHDSRHVAELWKRGRTVSYRNICSCFATRHEQIEPG